jgi:hypothetical protein
MNTRIRDTARAMGVFNIPMKALKPPTISAQGNVQVNEVAVGIRLLSFLDKFVEYGVPYF